MILFSDEQQGLFHWSAGLGCAAGHSWQEVKAVGTSLAVPLGPSEAPHCPEVQGPCQQGDEREQEANTLQFLDFSLI